MADPSRSRFRLPHWGWFLLATVVLVVGFVVVSVWLPYHRERQVIQRIESWGGVVGTKPRGGPDLLRHVVSEHRLSRFKVFDRIDSVDLSGAKITDSDIVHLHGLMQLDWLSLANTPVTDAGMAHLTKLKNLRVVELQGTRVTTKGFDVLQPRGEGPAIRPH